ncbi:DUF5672 family protein [Dyadobacter luticola]|uniref:DUF5672 domain-containing protein n=1 Tax=Dyadobacter luticola TaxID=1979387 RepID=A0A5R9KSB7_9BACT|nr:DUF5672 family protein [Dyadobacter luticola]TLU99172.1 hypothetical protein FEN17_21595 [Dyadobacter luticola]
MKELVSVLIPILDPQINPTEEKLLHHCLETLEKYPLIFVTFEGADLSIVREHNEDIDVIYFPKKYFESRDTLSQLFLLEDFYEHFNWSEFLLIHELNSWIIRDELHYWCKQGYDYLRADPFFGGSRNVGENPFARLGGLKEEEKRLIGQGYTDNGLYLCRIEQMTKTLKNKRKEAHQYRHGNLPKADAVFWDLEANRFWPNLRKPTAIVRQYFAQNAHNLDQSKNLPFAITGISRANIQSLSYFKTLPEAE